MVYNTRLAEFCINKELLFSTDQTSEVFIYI